MSKIGPWTKLATVEFRPITAVIAMGLVFSIASFVMTRGYFYEADRQQFQIDTAHYGTNFKNEVDGHINSLTAIRAFVSTSEKVSRWQFSNFANEILPRNSGFKAVFWLPHIGRAQRRAYEAELQRDGLYGLRLLEMTETGQLADAKIRPEYLPVTYIEPFESNNSLVGVDLLHNPIYAPLFEAAAMSGKIVVSPPLEHTLVDGAEQPTVLAVFPLIREADTSGGVASKTPQGYVLGVLQLNRIIEQTFGPGAQVEAAIAHGPEQSIYTNEIEEKVVERGQWFSGREFRRIDPFMVAGTEFDLAMRSTQSGNALTRLYVPAGAALLVLSLTILLAQSMYATTMRKQEVELAVLERTSDLNAEIGQRRQAEVDLKIAKDKAEGANRAKSAFLYTMSHELRTPLNAVIGFSSLLADQAKELNEQSLEHIQLINNSGVKLLNLVNDILEITQMDTEKDGADQLVYLSDIVDSVMERMRPQAAEAGIDLQSEISEQLPALHGDGKRLQKALHHLVSNAIKFTEKSGWVKITAQSSHGRVFIDVTDNGMGMPPAAATLIETPFSQFDSSLARMHEGVGLGLTYVRRVADSHDATLRIFSELGKGTRVVMDFPATRIVKTVEVA